MTYDRLVIRLAKMTGLHTEVVRRVLFFFPEALMEMKDGGEVRTPLGVFKKGKRKARPILLPDGKTPAVVAGQTVVKLRSGQRLIALDATPTPPDPKPPAD